MSQIDMTRESSSEVENDDLSLSDNAVLVEQEKHAKKRDELEKKIRNAPLRKVPHSDVPASAQVVIENNEWYKSFAKLSLFALLFTAACAATVSTALALVMTRAPETLSYLMDEDGRVVKLESVRNRTLTETEVLNWAAKKIGEIHSLNFTDYVDHVQSLRFDFTPEAFAEYQYALLSSKSIAKIKEDQLMMWSEPKEAPRIMSAKVVNGVFTWEVEMKIIQYMAGGEYNSSGTEMLSTIVIQRTSRARNLSGVIIKKYLAKEIIL